MSHCYYCGNPAPPDMGLGGVASCPTHGPLWKLVQQGPTANVIVERDGKILMVKRAHDPYIDHWCIPRGFSDYGEHPEDTARRELSEEAGVQVTLTGLLGIYVAPYARPSETDWIQTTVYLGITDDDPTVGDHETSEVGWFDPADPPTPTVPSHLVRLDDYLQGRLWRWTHQTAAGSMEPG